MWADRGAAMRRHDPRDNPGTVLATLVFGLLVLLVPVRLPAAPVAAPPAAAPGAPAGPAAPASPELPVPKVVAVSANPAVLASRPPDGTGPTVALTFDDGPDPTWTPRVLALLRRHRAVATFCVVGSQVRKHPQLLRDTVDAGMRLCDHSHSHPLDLGVAPAPKLHREIVGGRADIEAAVDAPVAYFRAPGGHWSPGVLRLAAEHRMQPLGWSVDLRDWAQPGVPAILSTLQQHLRPGAVILMHDGGGNREQTVQALAVMLPWLTDQGYRFTFPTP